jgi:endonuclease-3
LTKLFPDAKCALTFGNEFELLVAVILSAQCTDKKVNEVTAKLFKKYKKLDDYVNADPREFERDVFQTGFYRAKTKHILTTAKMVKEKFGGKVPDTMEDILTLRGVARKTANVVLGNAYGVVEGIAIDTHMKRLTTKHGLTDKSDPDKIEKDIVELLPHSEWLVFTYRLIEYGRTYCPARPHAHDLCPLTKGVAKIYAKELSA